jgi:hypothetical protein
MSKDSKEHKIDREFQLSDSTENCYGFRLLTPGYLKSEFEKNPIGYFMHEREQGVLLKWDNVRVDGDKILGTPVINLAHKRAQQTIDEIESGFLNAASVGQIVALEISDDPADYLPNQKGATVTKWYHRECSLVDVPGNYNSLKSELVDGDGNPLNLADFTPPTEIKDLNMEIKFTAANLVAMDLKADASSEETQAAFQNLVAKAKRTEDAEKALEDLKADHTKTEVKDLCADALKEGKITKEMSEKLSADYAKNPTGLKDLLGQMPKYTSITNQLKDGEGKTKLQNLMSKSWDDLHQSGELADLKALDENSFLQKKAEKYPSSK